MGGGDDAMASLEATDEAAEEEPKLAAGASARPPLPLSFPPAAEIFVVGILPAAGPGRSDDEDEGAGSGGTTMEHTAPSLTLRPALTLLLLSGSGCGPPP
jgi:hypothetical protein